MATRVRRIEDPAGASWEKRGNTVWLECPACKGWYPVGAVMLRAEAPSCHCPRCHHEFAPGATRPG